MATCFGNFNIFRERPKIAPTSASSSIISRPIETIPVLPQTKSAQFSQFNPYKDSKLKKKCVVKIERCEGLEKKQKEQIVFINQLLDMQREKLRQRALDRQRQREKQQFLLEEEERLKAEITELKRQKMEKEVYRAQKVKLRQQQESQLLTNDIKKNECNPVIEPSTISNTNSIPLADNSVKIIKVVELNTTKDSQKCTPQRPNTPDVDDNNIINQEVSSLSTTTKKPTPEFLTLSVTATPQSSTKRMKIRVKRTNILKVRSNVLFEKTDKKSQIDIIDDESVKSNMEKDISRLNSEKTEDVGHVKKSIAKRKEKSPALTVKEIPRSKKARIEDKFTSKSREMSVVNVTGDETVDRGNSFSVMATKQRLKTHLLEMEVSDNPTVSPKVNVLPSPDLQQLKQRTSVHLEPLKEGKNANSSEIVAATLTLLANMAATTAPIAHPVTSFMVKNVIKDLPPTPPEPPDIVAVQERGNPSQTTKEPATLVNEPSFMQQLHIVKEISKLSENTEVTAASATKEVTTMNLLNFEATPTVPAYLFNGESRDVPTPTLAVLGVVEQVVDMLPAAALIGNVHPDVAIDASSLSVTTATAISVLSTSDHEVSSTQETIYETPKRNLNTQSKQTVAEPTLLPDDSTTMLVQNNQIDTTHHLPESGHIVRRRARKLSTHDEISLGGVLLHQQRPVKKRRKTFCAVSQLSVASANGTLLNASHFTSGTSPSTTTDHMKKPQTRKRGRTPKGSTSNTMATTQQLPISIPIRKLLRSVSTSTPPPVYPANDDRIATMRTNYDSSCETVTAVTHTYSKSNVSQKVFVPAEIEECLDSEVGAPKGKTFVAHAVPNNERKKSIQTTTVNGVKIKTLQRHGRTVGKTSRKCDAKTGTTRKQK